MEKQYLCIDNKTILVTGAAGFIGSNLVLRLLSELHGSRIVGVDNLTDYNPVDLKEWRLNVISQAAIQSSSSWVFIKGDISDKELVSQLFKLYAPEIVINLAAQAGVRYSITNPDAYIQSNVIGFYNILEACRHSYDNDTRGVEHFIYASSSSVYGGNKKIPFSTSDMVDNPVSLYAATKKSNELFAYSYSKLYSIPSTGLRFFTVYGPAGRSDMFYFSATNRLVAGEKIQIFNYGDCKRDFTYIDDIVEGVFRVLQRAPKRMTGKDGLPVPPYAIYNIGGGTPENLMNFIKILSEELICAGILSTDFDLKKHSEMVPMQAGDVPITYADVDGLKVDYGFTPNIDLRTGLRSFVDWYKEYYMSGKINPNK